MTARSRPDGAGGAGPRLHIHGPLADMLDAVSRRWLVSGSSVVVAAGIGVLTNLITNQWSIALAVGLGLLIIAQVVLAVSASGSSGQNARASGHGVVNQAGRDVINPDKR